VKENTTTPRLEYRESFDAMPIKKAAFYKAAFFILVMKKKSGSVTR